MLRYDKTEIGKAAKECGFVRDTFEKVLRLKEILRYFNEEDYLKDHLLLKGGTAINLAIFNLPRLSVDIDMDYTPNDSRAEMLRAREKITALIKEYMEAEGYFLSQESRFSHSLDAFHFQYLNAGGNKDKIKIELNYSLRAHVFDPVQRRIQSPIFEDKMEIWMLEPMEIFAAKGNALISRAAARDLYDWGNLISENLFENDKDLFRQCFVFYTTISAEEIHFPLHTSAIDSLTFNKIRRDLFPVINRKDHFKLEERKEQAKKYIIDLLRLTDGEIEYVNCFIKKEYRPELLFEDDSIVERIRNHPMALWKCDKNR